MAININTIIWPLVLIGIIYMIYDFFFKNKKIYAMAHIFDVNNNWTPYRKPYKCFIRKTQKNTDKTVVSWLSIPKLGKTTSIPETKFNYRDNLGARNIYFAMVGKNLIPMMINKVSYILKSTRKVKDANNKFKKEYVCEKCDLSNIGLINEKENVISRMLDVNRENQYTKESMLEKFKPIIALAILGIMAIGIIVVTGQHVNKQSELLIDTANGYRDEAKKQLDQNSNFIEKFLREKSMTTTKIDNNTEVLSSNKEE